MTRGVNSLFFTALQQDDVQICELVELDSKTKSWRWANSNQDVPSSLQIYTPIPGLIGSGIEESSDMGIATIDFLLSNSGFNELIKGGNMDLANIVIRRVMTNSPDLGSMEIYRGKLSDFTYDRNQITGQARNVWNGINVQWPYYTLMDQCVWRFGGVGCAFDTSSITVQSGTILSSTSENLQINVGGAGFVSSGYVNGHFEKGRITFHSGVNSGEVRTVRAQSGDSVDLSHALPFASSSGDSYTIFRGCRKRLVEDCTSEFNNSSNFLGFPWIPRQENAF